MSDRVTITIEGGVADVRMNRPDKRNALDNAMFQALVDAGESLKLDPSVRAVVLSGEGASFCAGLDFGSFQQMAGGDAKAMQGDGAVGHIPEGRITHTGQQACWVWQEVPVPVIAAVHGHALGGGLQVALGADIRIVHPATKMSVLEVKWGLTPDMTATWVLPRIVALDVAKELTFTGRMVTGEEAVRLGLATRTSETPREDVLALAHEITGKSPHASRGAKALLNASPGNDPAAQFAMERTTIASLIGTPNQVEAIMAGFENRPAAFVDPAVDPS
jgi:enoyl-CoA hydratase/carnithine racemase